MLRAPRLISHGNWTIRGRVSMNSLRFLSRPNRPHYQLWKSDNKRRRRNNVCHNPSESTPTRALPRFGHVKLHNKGRDIAFGTHATAINYYGFNNEGRKETQIGHDEL